MCEKRIFCFIFTLNNYKIHMKKLFGKLTLGIITGGLISAAVIQAENVSSGSSCTVTASTYCCTLSMSGVTLTCGGGITPSVDACCVECGGKSVSGGYTPFIIGGKTYYCRAVAYKASSYPYQGTVNGKTVTYLSPCAYN